MNQQIKNLAREYHEATVKVQSWRNELYLAQTDHAKDFAFRGIVEAQKVQDSTANILAMAVCAYSEGLTP
jgi:hypothetical protein